ncbi:intermembrane transport protein PqiB [Bordetella petrii]|uniref:MlaD family protein n=1 Tax=Bordetella petrii TaxID=94624 RepID=A0ABT7W990_9BORD|nr:MlaD family protein [Bordetella petrii]MDM9561765.1 MlaD family protein [Bordetella petrii]
MTTASSAPPGAAPAITRKTQRIAWIWIVPVVAALAGLSLVVQAWMLKGPEVTISFHTAEGLEVGKTHVRYKDVVVGTVKNIRFDEGRSKVLVKIDFAKDSEDLAREGSRFWVVRPRLGISGVSGLGTLLSGAYIEVDTTGAGGRPQFQFQGLETPPEVAQDRPGTRYTLKADDLGSLEIGSPVYYRRIPVGRVIGYALDESGRFVKLQVFIDAPNDRFVTQHTRFWNASGVDLSLNASGMTLRTQSLVSVATGGVAFASPAGPDQPAASADQVFQLYPGEQQAHAERDGVRFRARFRFDQSVRGLSVGAPIDFRGLVLGEVTAITVDFDAQTREFYTVVDANVYPSRLGPAYEKIRRIQDPGSPGLAVVKPMVERGLRAQLRTGNLLTGQLYIALEIFPNAPPVKDFKVEGDPVHIPTIANNLDQLQHQLTNILDKVDKIPFEQIGAELHTVLRSTSRLLGRLDKEVAPELRVTLRQVRQSLAVVDDLLGRDSQLTGGTERALQELARAARSLRTLTDYLQANPQSLIRGRAPDVLPGERQ